VLAAGPELLAALQRVEQLAPAGSDAHAVAVDTLERFAQWEGKTLADWQPPVATLQPRTLRIAGVAT